MSARRRDRGSGLFQFALVLPALVLIVMAAQSLSSYTRYSHAELRLAVQAARWASGDYEPSVACPATWSASHGLQCYILQQEPAGAAAGSRVWIYQPARDRYRRGGAVRVCVLSAIHYASPLGDPSSTVAAVATASIAQATPGDRSLPYLLTNPAGRLPSQCPTG